MAMRACDHPDCAALDDTSSVECSETGVCVFDCAEDKDAAFIAHARTDLPALVEWAERAKPYLEGFLDTYSEEGCPPDDNYHEAAQLLAELDQGPRGV